jgi:hypothetical protein
VNGGIEGRRRKPEIPFGFLAQELRGKLDPIHHGEEAKPAVVPLDGSFLWLCAGQPKARRPDSALPSIPIPC